MFFEMTYNDDRIERLPLQRVRLFAKLRKLWRASRGTPPHYDLIDVLNRRIKEKKLNHVSHPPKGGTQ